LCKKVTDTQAIFVPALIAALFDSLSSFIKLAWDLLIDPTKVTTCQKIATWLRLTSASSSPRISGHCC
jgi:hypothetical protein